MQQCPITDLHRIAKLLRLELRFLFYLNSKSFTSLLFLLLERGEELTTEVFLSLLRNYPLRLISCRCYQLLMSWIVSNDSDPCSLRKKVGQNLASLPTSIVSYLIETNRFQFFIYVVLSSLKDSDPAILGKFLQRKTISLQVASLTGKISKFRTNDH